jgi:hypothetical protein
MQSTTKHARMSTGFLPRYAQPWPMGLLANGLPQTRWVPRPLKTERADQQWPAIARLPRVLNTERAAPQKKAIARMARPLKAGRARTTRTRCVGRTWQTCRPGPTQQTAGRTSIVPQTGRLTFSEVATSLVTTTCLEAGRQTRSATLIASRSGHEQLAAVSALPRATNARAAPARRCARGSRLSKTVGLTGLRNVRSRQQPAAAQRRLTAAVPRRFSTTAHVERLLLRTAQTPKPLKTEHAEGLTSELR